MLNANLTANNLHHCLSVHGSEV